MGVGTGSSSWNNLRMRHKGLQSLISKLVGGLEHVSFFHIGNNSPMWLIFFRGVGQPPTRRWWWKYVVALSENGVPYSIHWLIISFPIQPAGKPFQTSHIKSWMSELGTAGAIPCPSFSPWSSLARWDFRHGYAWHLLEGEKNHLRRCQNFFKKLAPVILYLFKYLMYGFVRFWFTWKLGGATFDWVDAHPATPAMTGCEMVWLTSERMSTFLVTSDLRTTLPNKHDCNRAWKWGWVDTSINCSEILGESDDEYCEKSSTFCTTICSDKPAWTVSTYT